MADAAAPRWRLPLAALACGPVLLHLAIVATRHVQLAFVPRLAPMFKLGLVSASAAGHWAIYATLFWTFARTLAPGRDPLISAMARRLHGPLTGELARYTRRVTLAWSCFFAAQLATSVTLFLAAPLVVWSFFVNILDLPLVAAMFAAEYGVRLRCLKDPPRHSLAAIIRMIAQVRNPEEQPAVSP